jgi:PAS domain S-box-containing protein
MLHARIVLPSGGRTRRPQRFEKRMARLTDARRNRRSRIAILAAYAAIGIGWILLGFQGPAVAPVAIGYFLITGALLWAVLYAGDERRERGQSTLAVSEERHRLLVEHQQDVVYRLRLAPEPGFEYVSPSIERITGRSPEEHYRDPRLVRELFSPEDLAQLARASTADGGPVLLRWRTADGSTISTEHRVSPFRDDENRLVAVAGVARDVTARTLIDERNRRLTGAIAASPAGVAVLTRHGDRHELSYVNPALATIAGIDAADLAGHDVEDFSEVLGSLPDPEFWAKLATGAPFELETTLQRPDGRPAPIRILVSPIADATGASDSIIAIVVDRGDAVAREAAEARLGLVLDASPAPIVVTDAADVVTEWNPAAERVFGWMASEAVGQRLKVVPDDASAAFDALHERVMGEQVPAEVEVPLVRRDGRRIQCRVQAALIPVVSGAAPGMVCVIEDLSAQIEQQHAQARLASAIDAAGEAILITNLDGAITYVNPAFERVSGYGREELIGRNPRILQSGLTSASSYADMWQRLKSGQVWRGVLFNRRKDGSLFEEEATLSPVFGSDGNPIAYVGVKRDLTLERTLAAGLSTELNDRAAVQETMARLETGETPEETAQLLCEALASYPDVGESLLVRLARSGETADLLGVAGDTAAGQRIGDLIDAELSAAIRLRATGGAWTSQQPGVPRLPRAADEDTTGLTTVAAPVRHRGRPVAVLYLVARTDSPDAWIARHLRIASELAAHVGPMIGPQLARRDSITTSPGEVARIIHDGRFTPLFQPVCDLRSGVPIGWESLTRFADGVPPSRRFSDAQRLGLGAELELACGIRAVEAFAVLGRRGWLSVNLTPSLLLGGRAGSLVATATCPIVLELTEAVAPADYARLRDVMAGLKAPAMIAVDDTGAGYSSLRQVLDLRPEYLKLDLGLVHGIDRDTARQALVAGIVHHAAQAGTHLIAEGVETEAERRVLLRLGVEYGQGLLLGAPTLDGEPASPSTPAPGSTPQLVTGAVARSAATDGAFPGLGAGQIHESQREG